jgi:hypothetical protein
VVVVPLAQKHALAAVSDLGEPVVADQDAVQAVDLGLVERTLAGFENGAPPALEPIGWRAFRLDLKARAAVGEEENACGPGNDMSARSPYRLSRLVRKVEGEKCFQFLCAPDDRTERARAKQIVAHTMAQGQGCGAGEIGFGIECIDGGNCGGIVDVACRSGFRKRTTPAASPHRSVFAE